jgi:pyruvate,water dikinase
VSDDRAAADVQGTDPDLVLLDDPAATRAELVGEKFASLARARLEIAGLPGVAVPPAVAVTSDAVPRAIAGELDERLRDHLDQLADGVIDATPWAVRSSSPDEDLAAASHAGVYDSVLGVHGLDELRGAIEVVAASATGARARAYRGDDRTGSAASWAQGRGAPMAVIVQRQVRADLGGWSGVVFSHDPETGRPDVVLEAVPGEGAPLVSGRVDPQRWHLRDGQLAPDGQPAEAGPPPELLARVAQLASALAEARGAPVDVEWAVAADASQLALLQVRPLRTRTTSSETDQMGRTAALEAPAIVEGLAVGRGTVQGRVLVVEDPDEVHQLEPDTVLVVRHTDPSWMALLLQAAALVTDVGGRTSHAAIVARELGLLAVVGCADATMVLSEMAAPRTVRVQCRDDGVGLVYRADHVG